jgi:group I intron endonuclease
MSFSRYGSIYVATNTANNMQYVGQTKQQCKVRFSAHKISAQKPKFNFGKALAEYGYEAFIFQEVYNAFDKPTLDHIEKLLISELTPEYNMTSGGAGQPASFIRDETKKKRSDSAKARWANPEWHAKTTAALKKAGQSPEAKERGRQLNSLYNGGKVRWANHTKVVKVPVTIEERAEMTRASWKNEEVRAKRILGLNVANATPECRANRSKAQLGRKMPKEQVDQGAYNRMRPIYCKELNVTFLSGVYAAEHFNVGKSAISNVIKSKGKLYKQYSLEKVA